MTDAEQTLHWLKRAQAHLVISLYQRPIPESTKDFARALGKWLDDQAEGD